MAYRQTHPLIIKGRRPLKIKGYLSDLQGNALMMTARGNFLYLMYVHELGYRVDTDDASLIDNQYRWLKCWMTPMDAKALTQYKEIIKYSKEYDIPQDRRNKLYDQKLRTMIPQILDTILDPQQAGPTWKLFFTDNEYWRNKFKSQFKVNYGKDLGQTIPNNLRWKHKAKDDKQTYSPIRAIYSDAFRRIINQHGATGSKMVNFINYQVLPEDFWLTYYRQVRKT